MEFASFCAATWLTAVLGVVAGVCGGVVVTDGGDEAGEVAGLVEVTG
jgi:hypothetical protein